MVIRKNILKSGNTFTLLVIVFLALCSQPKVEAQYVTSEPEFEQVTLGSVQIGEHSILIMMAYQVDAVLLTAAFLDDDGKTRYIPLKGATYRGMPSFKIDVLSSDINNKIWFRLSKPESEVLAYYHLGSETALTQFGIVKLLETPFPEHLSGGPIPFPKDSSDALQLKASFFHYNDM